MLADRPFQELAIAAARDSKLQRKLIVLPTGTGKTITALKLAKQMTAPLLWLAHTDELVTQPIKSMPLVWPEATTGIVKAEFNQWQRDCVFASVQSAQQDKRIEQLASRRWSQVVVDEAHRALSPGYLKILHAVGCFTDGGPSLVGITATPERSDAGALDEVFQGIVFQMDITHAINAGYLVAPRVVERKINVDLDAVTVTRGDYGQKQLDVALMQAGIVQEIASAYEAECIGRKTIAFVVSVDQAEQVAMALRQRGHKAAAVSGAMDREERRRIIKRLHDGDLDIVVNCMVLTEGFDEPSVSAIILGRPTQSKPLLIQKVGRGLRLYPGKTDCLVIDLVGASKRHTLVQAAVLFGLKPDPMEREPRPQDIDPIADPEEYWRRRLETQITGVRGAPQSKLRWVPSTHGGWLLDAGIYGTVRMYPLNDAWKVDAVGIKTGDHRNIDLSHGYVALETAQALAEDYVRRVNAISKAQSDAEWRNRSASSKDIEFLRRSGVKVAEGITKGTAADLALQQRELHATERATPKQLWYLKSILKNVPPNLTKREAQHMIIKALKRKPRS